MSLSALKNHLRRTSALEQAAGVLSWDQEAIMPTGGAGQRAEQLGAMAAVIHDYQSDPRIAEWIDAIDNKELSAFDQRNIAEAKRSYDRATKLPADLAEALAKGAATGQSIWVDARKKGDFKAFAPALTEMVNLKRREAEALTDDGDLYDALLDEFEPGARVADLSPLLESLRPDLTHLRQAIAEKGLAANQLAANAFPAADQLSLAQKIADKLGYDLTRGRIDTVTHPFCSGTGDDVRITTRTDESDPFNCLYSTIHEVGHALYAQGAPDAFLPAADYCSMGVHESQSRFWENQIARSRPFMDWLHPAMTEAFGDAAPASADALYQAVNNVETGFIRTEADEIHYNLHILLRFELERDLISGDLDVSDLEAEWNMRFERDFGRVVTDPAMGVLQDVHWSAGLFGYFPTYSLGNIYAACLDEAMRAEMPNRDEMVRQGETAPILSWLRANIHEHGRVLTAPELIEQATGKPPSAAPLVAYLKDKFGTLYDL
ncbi:MAG: carboxypeptidase M32 [Pikeienuella sp.]